MVESVTKSLSELKGYPGINEKKFNKSLISLVIVGLLVTLTGVLMYYFNVKPQLLDKVFYFFGPSAIVGGILLLTVIDLWKKYHQMQVAYDEHMGRIPYKCLINS